MMNSVCNDERVRTRFSTLSRCSGKTKLVRMRSASLVIYRSDRMPLVRGSLANFDSANLGASCAAKPTRLLTESERSHEIPCAHCGIILRLGDEVREGTVIVQRRDFTEYQQIVLCHDECHVREMEALR